MPKAQIRNRQIADAAISNAKVAPGAGIETSKLADGGSFIRSDGTVAFTGAPNAGNNRVINVATPTATGDAANKSYVDNLIAGVNTLFSSKQSARVASVGNLTLSGPQTVNGVALTAGQRVLVRAQTAQAENGIYQVNAGAWTRTTDADTWVELVGALVVVEEGTTLADSIWLCTSNQGGTLGTTPVAWTQTNVAAGSINFADKEIPAGALNGVNVTFTLANLPTAGSEHLYINGLLMEPGAGNDYTITGNTITLADAPLAAENIRASYRF